MSASAAPPLEVSVVPPGLTGPRGRLEPPILRTPPSMHDLRDFRPDLRSAIDQLHVAGYDREAYVLTAALEGAYGSALEMLGAIGSAVLRVERGLGPSLPSDVHDAFQRSLTEVRKALPLLN